MSTTPEVGIDHLTMLDVPPPELVTIAREAGLDLVGLRVAAATPGEESWPMSVGSPKHRETVRRLDDTGIRVLAVEVLRIGPGTKQGGGGLRTPPPTGQVVFAGRIRPRAPGLRDERWTWCQTSRRVRERVFPSPIGIYRA